MYLAAAAAVALIMAYYLRRHQAPQVYFSATRFLPQSTRVRVIRSALPPPRLLLPILILALLTLSLAQPVASRMQPAPVGIIIDDGAFASGDKAQAPLRQIALTVADKLSSDTPWGLYTTSGAVLADGVGKQELAALLGSYTGGPASGSYSPAVFRQAASFLEQRAGAAPVLLLIGSTDTMRGYPGLDSLRAGLEKEGIKLIPVASQSSSKPVFIAATGLPALSLLDTEARARIGIANTGKETLGGELRLLNGSAVLVRTPVKLPGQSLSWQELTVKPKDPGPNKYTIALSVNMPGATDDEALWEMNAFAPQTAIIIASPSNSNPGYVEKAFKSSPLVKTVTIIDPEALDVTKLKQTLSSARVVVMDGVDAAVFLDPLGTELRTWVESGGTLVFSSGPKVTEAWNKRILSAILPAAFNLTKNKQVEGVKVQDSPITRNLEMASTPLTVAQYLSVEPAAPGQVLISVGSEPMLLFKKAGKGTAFLWTSTTDPRWNNWAQQPSFPVFWSNILVYAITGDTPRGAGQVDATRALWHAASPSAQMTIYYIDYKADPVALPGPLQAALDQPARSYRDYHWVFLAAGLALVLGFAAWTVYGRRTRR